MTGLGATSADAVYGFIAGFGLTSISSFLINYQISIKFLGGVFLIYLGIKICLSKPPDKIIQNNKHPSAWQKCVTTFFLTLNQSHDNFVFH